MSEADGSEVVTEQIVAGPAVALAGLLGHDPSSVTDGFVLPLMWHLVYLLERPAASDLGPEGHPVHGIPRPPRPGLRRMFAGGRVRTFAPLPIGAAATRTTGVVGTREHVGRSGAFTLVTTRSVITRDDGVVVVVDEQDIVYREPRRLAAVDPATARRLPEGLPSHPFQVDQARLFQFSALTYNAHRIHYDIDYCRDVEDYDGLVVHGPLQALLMADAAAHLHTQVGSDGTVATFAYRLVAPVTLGRGLRIAAGPATSDPLHATATCEAFATDGSGRVTATSTLTTTSA